MFPPVKRARVLAAAVVSTGLVLGSLTAGSTATAATPAHSSVVSADPINVTPNVISSGGEVIKLLYVKGVMWAGGRFTAVAPAGSSSNGLPRYNMFAFHPTSGAIYGVAPRFDGEVTSIASDGTYLYVGGKFRTVNGVARRSVAKLTLTGSLVTSFNATSIDGIVNDLQLVNGRVIVGGAFGKRLAALSPTTGADTGYINLGITGSLSTEAGAPFVYRFATTPDGRRLVAIGNFTTVSGFGRSRAFQATLGDTKAALNSWYYKPLARMCSASSMPAYLRDVDFSPDGSYFAIVSTGFVPRSGDLGLTLCDAAARFETTVASPARPTWINYTGGDTLHGVTVTGAAVYVGGHQRWLDNAHGTNAAGPGAVAREGIGAIHPTTGKALPWNPGRERGVGAKELYPTSTGLWMGHDTNWVAGERRMRLAFWPL